MMKCDKCGEEETLFESIDTWACTKCDEWKEPKCDSADCSYCMDRKEKPSLQNDRGQSDGRY